jgi:branched-chain amino acid transport system substrate-binding protein
MSILRRSATLVFLVAAVLAVGGCKPAPVIGVLVAETGDAAPYGSAMRQAMELAVDEAKESGEYPDGLAILWADSATNPDTAAANFEQLASDGARLVIVGVTSDEAKALLPVIESTNTLALSPSASAPTLARDSSLFYRVFPSDELEGRRAGRFLREDRDAASVVIYTLDSAQARGIEPPFRHVFEQTMEGEVVGKVVLSDNNWEEHSADLLTAHQPESAYIIAYADETLDAIRHLRRNGFPGVICVSSAFYTADVVSQNAEMLEGVFFPQPAFDIEDERPLVQDFVTAYEQRTGQIPDIYAAHAFDAMRVALAAVRNTSFLDTEDLKKTMRFGLSEFPGVTGPISFDEQGDVHHNPIIFSIREGRVVNHERWVKKQKEDILRRIRAGLTGEEAPANP